MVWNGAVGYYNSDEIVYYVAEVPLLAPSAKKDDTPAKKDTPKK